MHKQLNLDILIILSRLQEQPACLPSFPFETAQDRWLNVWVLNYISLFTLNAD